MYNSSSQVKIASWIVDRLLSGIAGMNGSNNASKENQNQLGAKAESWR
jgi:hypothetical protein